MNLNHYIFVSDEGYTFQPNKDELGDEVDNLQVIGLSEGETPSEAFKNLVQDNTYLAKTTFNELKCYKICSPQEVVYFNLKDESKSI